VIGSIRTRPFLAVLALTAAIVVSVVGSASAATFTVTSQNDMEDGLCDLEHCSLRDAIRAANATLGADEILFQDDEPITPVTPLPAITDTTHFISRADRRCRADSAPLQLDGNGADFPGLVFAPGSDGSRICLVNVRGFTTGIEFRSDNNAIRLSTIGISPEGTFAEPNSDDGILVTGNNNLIGGTRSLDRNVISGNTISGVFVAGAAGTRIEGNLIGTDSLGSIAVPNGVGVMGLDDALDTTVAGNVISGNDLFGVILDDGRLVGNLIGLDAPGTAAVPNGKPGFTGGILANGPIRIGGPTEAERNVIGGHEVADVLLRAPATVQGNWIGLTPDGTEIPGDSVRKNGIRLLEGADGATIGGTRNGEENVIAGHDVDVESDGSVNGFAVQGNLIGLAADGIHAVTPGTGIKIGAGTTGALVGGVEDGAGNTVTTDFGTGIAVAGDRTRIEGNTVGLDKDGDVLNQESGIAVDEGAEGTRIGGDSRGAGNTISGNLVGLELRDASSGTIVEGNFVGTDRDGMAERFNDVGVSIGEEETGLVGGRVEARIGGRRSAQRNVISGNQDVGVSASCPTGAVVIEGNYIGVAADGGTPLGNGVGLSLGCSSPVAPAPVEGEGFVVGGTVPGAGNRIAHNVHESDFTAGVSLEHTIRGVMILGNQIFDNGGAARDLGIDFLGDGVSANGSQSPDVLPPFPVLTNVDLTSAGTLVQGTIDYPAGRDVRLEFFSNPSCDASGHGEGQNPLGALTLTGSGGPAAFAARVAAAPAGHAITATATDLDLHRTSEFSRCATATPGPPPPADPPDQPSPGLGPGGDPPASGPVVGDPGPIGLPPVIDPPPTIECEVPKLAGLTLAKAKKRLRAGGCGIGKITRPNKRPRGNGFKLVIKNASQRPGTVLAEGTRIRLTLKFLRKPRR
jgi:CSLREA domain-containing protein